MTPPMPTPTPAVAPAAPAPQGAVYSLAYSPYAGRRRPPAFAPLVIAKYALAAQLRQRGVKIALLLGVLLLAIFAVYAGFTWALPTLAAGTMLGGGAPLNLAAITREGEGDVLTLTLRAQFLPTFLLMIWCGAGAISSDLMAGAFQFHFSRPVSPTAYLAGRLASALGWALALSVATLAVLCAERLAFQSTPLGVARAFALGLVAVLLEVSSLAAVALGVSSLTRRKGLAQAMFAAIVFAGWVVLRSVGALLEVPWVKTLDLVSCVDAIVAIFNHDSPLHGAQTAIPVVAWCAWTFGALGLAAWRLSRAEVNRG